MNLKRAETLVGAIMIAMFLLTNPAKAQNESAARATAKGAESGAAAKARPSQPRADLSERERMLLDRIEKLEQRVTELESRSVPASKTAAGTPLEAASPLKVETGARALNARPEGTQPRPSTVAAAGTDSNGDPVTTNSDQISAVDSSQASKEDRGLQDFLRGTTINIQLDGYYGYNFNKPIGRINLLRAYDVSSNSFSLNQADLVIERAPDVEAGRRFGVRLDLQYGQATETLQGNAANEPRPQVYRNVWQAYGTYVVPIGSGLTVDFGKFASSLGYETNYTKDNFNYSRSYYFNFLPFYHFGFRTRYQINDKVAVMYHVMNGVQQSEDFNGFKSQHFAVILTPNKALTWQVNYYVGREQRDLVPQLNPGLPALPTQPGLSTNVVRPTPDGRLHILDTYATWNATGKLTFAAEADYVISRVQSFSAPSRVSGGVLYSQYKFTPKFSLAGRAEYLSDRGGLFSGTTQALKETTLTASYLLASGFMMRAEWRRDFSNQPFFLTSTQDVLSKQQNTATLGLIWWIGRKEGSW